MDVFARAEAAFGMTEDTWARHANPWSGATRITILPLLALAIWARVWIGWWALLPVGLLVLWAFVNPRAFPPPADHGHWMTRAVLGERWFLARNQLDLPRHHVGWAIGLSALAALGLPLLVWGLWFYDAFAVLLGLALTVGGKLWFLDRMVWLYADMTGDAAGRPLFQPTFPPETSK